MLYETAQRFCTVLAELILGKLEDLHGGCFEVRSHVENFLESRNTKSDVLRRNTSEMEGIQRHLSCRFANGLCSKDTNHLTRIGLSSQETVLNVSKNMI